VRADVGVYGLEVGLVDHAELVGGFFRVVSGIGAAGVRGGGFYYYVESSLQDGCERDALDAAEGEVGDGFFEAEDDAGGEEVEVAWE
jgi:hypothetical protein